jgi:hypothetical protein
MDPSTTSDTEGAEGAGPGGGAKQAGETSLVPVSARIFAAVVGIGLVVTGAIAVFVTANSAGAASLVAAGTVIGALAMFANRIQSVEGGGVKLQLEAAAVAATAKLQAARQAEQAGHRELAETLRDEAQLLMSAVQPVAAQYENVRLRESSSWDRTAKLERVMQQVREMAPSDFADPGSVSRLFDSGTDGNRIAAIALMQANPALASTRITLAAIRNPRSNFEQYHALRVAEAVVARDPEGPDACELLAAVAQALHNRQLGSADSDRNALARRILAMAPPANG